MRAGADRKPKAILVSSRILVVPDSDCGGAGGEVDEGRDAEAAAPGQPAGQGGLAGLALGDEHVAQTFFEQVGAVQAGVGLGDPGQLVPLPVGEVVGVFQSA